MLTKYYVFWHLIWYAYKQWSENVEYCEEVVQFGSKMRENLKMFGDKTLFGDKHVYPSCNPIATKLQLK
jgi:hypothetical protein